MSKMGFEFQTTVLPGHKIQITAPELPEGSSAKVIVEITPTWEKRSVSEILATQAFNHLFESANQADAHIRQERDSWGG